MENLKEKLKENNAKVTSRELAKWFNQTLINLKNQGKLMKIFMQTF